MERGLMIWLVSTKDKGKKEVQRERIFCFLVLYMQLVLKEAKDIEAYAYNGYDCIRYKNSKCC